MENDIGLNTVGIIIFCYGLVLPCLVLITTILISAIDNGF